MKGREGEGRGGEGEWRGGEGRAREGSGGTHKREDSNFFPESLFLAKRKIHPRVPC